uniref:Nucleolar protein 16 n=1 Tax=Albugo laibachii Nc14 TaxID=890382 RepID=F0W679_9STRA|nr:conserved hypothetical protein [Albugo laibachii Nc14]|eukprot:CCA16621.1 conserved hypothetical protein [Albugo laibachii Nc14]
MPRIRRRHKVKVKRRLKPQRKYRNKFVGDQNVQKQWDHKKTVRQNYEKIGLLVDSNACKDLREAYAGVEGDANIADTLYEVPDSDFLNERNPKRPENHMSEEEIKYLRPLIAKHKENYKAMELDIKVNCFQWTENKLRRRCARLALLDANIIQ